MERTRQTLKLFARAARAGRVYSANNATVVRMMEELERAFGELLTAGGDLSLSVRADAFLVDQTPVLEEPNPEDSIPFAFYRDGVRRLDFRPGLERWELTGLVAATARGLRYSGIGDDIVAELWRLDLQNIDYLAVETTILDHAPGEAASSSIDAAPLDARIDGLLRHLFGSGGDDPGPLSFRLDQTDLPAKMIADALGDIGGMRVGINPRRGPPPASTLGPLLLREAAEEGDFGVLQRGVDGAARGLANARSETELTTLAGVLLRMLDAALIDGQLIVAARLVLAFRHTPSAAPLLEEWMAEVVSETRFRHVGGLLKGPLGDEVKTHAFAFFRSCGPWAVEPLLALLPAIPEQGRRRELCDLIARLGPPSPEALRPLLENEQAYVAMDGIYLLQRLSPAEVEPLSTLALRHPGPRVRAELVTLIPALGSEAAQELVATLLTDPELEVRITALNALPRLQGRSVELLAESQVQRASFAKEPPELKRAALESYARLAGPRGVALLVRLVREGDGLFAHRDAEETATAAVWGLGAHRSRPSIDALKKACTARSRKVREAAREVLQLLKETE